jgi:hypothetical protein
MKISLRTDFALNILLPLCMGAVIYWAAGHFSVPSPVRNYFPDALWAYSLMSAILLVWQRRIVIGWVFAAFALSIGFEVGQHYHWVPGTGDFYDCLTYGLSFGLALALNPLYEKQDKTSPVLLRPRPLRGPRRLLES